MKNNILCKAHQNWSRRQFLRTGSMASLGSLLLGTTPVAVPAPNKLMAALNSTESDRILVLIYQFGGNDGLNTVIPHTDAVGLEEYLGHRPEISQKYGADYNDNMLLSGFGETTHALNTALDPLMNLWHNDQMHIIHKVGIGDAEPNFSHFISRDLWFGGASSATDNRTTSGWMGRYLEELYPAFLDAPSATPPALKIGSSSSKVFSTSQGGGIELVFANPASFHQIATAGTKEFYDTSGLGDCPSHLELGFIRQTANSSLQYADTTFSAYERGDSNEGDYPDKYISGEDLPSDNLVEQLKIVARLIKGKLGTKVYMVNMGGFDNHADQLEDHPKALNLLAASVKAFYEDLAAGGDGDDERVVVFPFSEFGRTIKENTGFGTDHGTLSDLMLFGKGINGGFSGTPIDFDDDQLTNGRADFMKQEGSIDYRSIYATLLQDWLCVDGVIVDYALGDHYPRIPNLITNPCTTNREETPEILLGHRSQLNNSNVTEIRYGILQPGKVSIKVYNQAGQKLVTLVDKHHTPGTYTFPISPQTFPFPTGQYLYKMQTGGKEYAREIAF